MLKTFARGKANKISGPAQVQGPILQFRVIIYHKQRLQYR